MLAAAEPAWWTLLALLLFILASMWIGLIANRAMREGSFMKGFFLGNRGLGPWALALTATVQSGGTFMGFPSFVYSHGWAVAVWIASYMVVPLTGFAVLGKRISYISRKAGAVTIPDLFRERFRSPTLGLLASLFILFYMSFMMVAQFKGGALVMKISWQGTGQWTEDQNVGVYRLSRKSIDKLTEQGVSSEVLAALGPLVGRKYPTDVKFTEEVRAAVGTVSSVPPAEIPTLSAKITSSADSLTDWAYITGLVIFTLTVIGYTLLGGFLAAVWTDLFQSVMMWAGVMVLLVLSLQAVGRLQQDDPQNAAMNRLEYANRKAVAQTSPEFVQNPGYDPDGKGRMFLPIGLAFSFFWIWVFGGLGSPAGIVRVMACRSTRDIRRSIILLGGYNTFIYPPLIAICICGRALIPDIPAGKTDDIIPRLAMLVTKDLPAGQFIAGLILAAPFGAIMATVSSYLVVIASGIVRDVYQRFIDPEASSKTLERLSHGAMILVGVVAVLASIKPVAYLQAIVVFSTTGTATTFCIPALMLAFWRRASVPGTIAAMIAGASTMLSLYIAGFTGHGNQLIGAAGTFRAYFLLGIDPMIWGLLASFVAGVVVSLLTPPPDPELVSKYFDAEPPSAAGKTFAEDAR